MVASVVHLKASIFLFHHSNSVSTVFRIFKKISCIFLKNILSNNLKAIYTDS